eukprot:GILK01005403.1.p1 GENE.GILK01005403.1~~GILK01005403.1.p1  ORF type:complete len:549 (+),score=127.10 GILK01005403.1:51-1697(+)
MSNIYVTEPPTKGKVILKTTHGDIDIELWPKETPKATRNFVQLCLEGYYDGTDFHRVIKGFMVQGGDPTGTGTGGESIYGEPFADEIHSRLRFSHRGIVAMANSGPSTNASQFFITLDRTDHLDRMHTIFGKVVGDTIFNVLRIGELEVDKRDKPVVPCKILSVEVLFNPFEDIVPRALPKRITKEAEAPKRVTQAAKKNLSLLSFGEEAEEEEIVIKAGAKKGIVSSHDVLDDPRLSKQEAYDSTTIKKNREATSQQKKKEQEDQDKRESLKRSVAAMSRKGEKEREERRAQEAYENEDEAEHEEDGHEGSGEQADRGVLEDDDEEMEGVAAESFEAKMRNQVLSKRKRIEDKKAHKDQQEAEKKRIKEDRKQTAASDSKRKRDESADESDRAERKRKTKVGEEYKRLNRDTLVLKKGGKGTLDLQDQRTQEVQNADLKTPLQIQREKYAQRKKRTKGREDEVLAKLDAFKSTIQQSKTDEDDWMNNSLRFAVDSARAYEIGALKDDLMTIDPRKQKGDNSKATADGAKTDKRKIVGTRRSKTPERW